MDHAWWGSILTAVTVIIYGATWWIYRDQLHAMRLQVEGMRQQIESMQKQMQEDHERSRREETLRLMRFWAEQVEALPISLPNIMKLCRSMEREKLIALFGNIPFDVPSSEADLVKGCLPGEFDFEILMKDDKIVMHGQALRHIRKHAFSLLNLFEVIAAAWFDQIGDRDLLEREFGVAIDKNKELVVSLNRTFGYYPSAVKFVNRSGVIKEPHRPTGV